MKQQPKRVIEIVGDEPAFGLLTAHQASAATGVSADRLTELANAGYAPHWRIDGGPPLFKRDAVKKWVRENLVLEHPGRPAPTLTVLRFAEEVAPPREVPPAIARVRPPPADWSRNSA